MQEAEKDCTMPINKTSSIWSDVPQRPIGSLRHITIGGGAQIYLSRAIHIKMNDFFTVSSQWQESSSSCHLNLCVLEPSKKGTSGDDVVAPCHRVRHGVNTYDRRESSRVKNESDVSFAHIPLERGKLKICRNRG